MKELEKEIDDIVEWLRNSVKEAGAKGLVLGLSGGIDSSVVAALAKRAFPNDSLGIIMPCDSIDKDEEDARLVANAVGIEITKVDLTRTFNTYLEDSFISENRMARSNIKPRLRMSTLYYYGQDRNYLVCGCSNGSEYHIGYYTKYGDSGSDLIPLVGFLKDEVFELAKILNIPQEIIDKKPSAGLWENQTDESEMGFSYEDLNNHIRGKEIDKEIAGKIDRMHKNSAHKREFAKVYKRS